MGFFIEISPDRSGFSLTATLMSLNRSKECAIQEIAELLTIPPNKIIVFGDDFNDIGMFHLCGYPVAMGNAIEELKCIAREVTDTNDNDGVAKTIEALFELY
ncbi:HAD hydrolase family protein [Bacillus weihaiensis]|uniref:Uncharacterized protein n=1 Tax=Bacillus weihaiensis TaxID=1547283 RepID=A0A1L3MVE2_9BACI|nr:HAD hydrolase family protein [Bacillus weihaiensis]APH06240.1 hypothetical protein A9C19_16740 [Bacillus weihaiensis]